jgi:hypothetical protein
LIPARKSSINWIDQLDLSKARRIGTDAKRVNVDFPAWMVDYVKRCARA